MSTKVTKDKGGTRKKPALSGAKRSEGRTPTRSEARKTESFDSAASGRSAQDERGNRRGIVALATPTPEPRPAIAVHEPTTVHQERLEALLGELGYPCTAVGGDVDELTALLAGERAPEALIVGLPGSEALIAATIGRGRALPAVIAALAGTAATAVPRAREAGADLLLLRPHSRDSLVTVLQAAAALQTERRAARAQQATADSLRERLLRYGQADAVTGFQHFDFFEHLLVMELKRARRYGYPLAVCLVANDPWDPTGLRRAQVPPAEAARTLRTRVAAAITACIRDIDVPVDFAEDRFLVFLPYTDIDGAALVGRRVAQVVKSQGSVSDGEKRWRMSVSVGIAATRPGAPLSFAKLMRDANAAVRAAQLKGGGRVVVRR